MSQGRGHVLETVIRSSRGVLERYWNRMGGLSPAPHPGTHPSGPDFIVAKNEVELIWIWAIFGSQKFGCPHPSSLPTQAC